ncbi:MAG: carboxypeptidase regulatory-like domain-containing protein [Acidobacteria bacterium Pan2503]|uniref:Carboxypeptidase regulatory-like domain-containing protein n=1 Tax=Candidatus Acidiferrum panamense TaxID=2741543 RepID=A0A7V8SXQ2_9BACT|nr:carboxypeptidase regulatory-like domain-containing protein [Candidatus Acidoferrum panamensis]
MTLAGAALLRADVTGSILGVVHDRSQAVISGARIVVTNVQTNFKQDATSGADGSYHLLALPAGNYQLSVTAAGFRTFTEKDIVVKVNDELRFRSGSERAGRSNGIARIPCPACANKTSHPSRCRCTKTAEAR